MIGNRINIKECDLVTNENDCHKHTKIERERERDLVMGKELSSAGILIPVCGLS